MELVRKWLVGVTCASLIAALAEGLMPRGPVKQVGKLACALVLLWAVLSPLAGVGLSGGAEGLEGLREQTEQYQKQLEEENGEMMKTLIEQECGAYIADKAAAQGLSCQVRVECRSGPSGTWEPWSAQITGALTQQERTLVSRMLEEELNIPAQRHSYEGGSDGT